MESYFNYKQIKGLQQLLTEPKNESDSEDDLPQAGAKKLGPGDIKCPESGSERVGPHAPLKGEGDNIWHSSEATTTEVFEDPRVVPQYEIKFKQSVGTENVFFGMGFKTPSTASCEWLVISIKLPSEIHEKIELSVESDKVDLRSPRYRLHLPTPFPVDPNSSSANWYTDTSTLEINLRMKRELDVINF